MIEIVRASVRLVLFFINSLLTVLLVAGGNLLFGIFNSQLAKQWKNIVIGNWAKITSLIIGLDVNIKGTSPDPPFFLVTNHLSYIDVVPLWSALDATFVAKSEIKSWPFFGWGTRTLGVLFIDRELKSDVHRMNQKISEAISDSQGVILFPEGTSSKGEKVLPFNAPLLEYPAANEMPVSYASITYQSFDQSRPAHSNICWWGDMSFFSHFWELLKMNRFEVSVQFGDQTIIDTDRKELSQKLQKAVSQIFTPVDAQTENMSTGNNSDK